MALSSPIASASMPPTFLPREPLAATFRVGMQSAGVGLLASALQNSLQRHDKGAMGIFTRTGGTIALFAGMGAAFTYVDSTVANLREKNDAVNGIAGGCAAGFIAGLKQRSIPAAFGACAIIGTVIGTFDASGGTMSSEKLLKPRAEREQDRLSKFKQRSLEDSVNTDQLKRRGIEVEAA